MNDIDDQLIWEMAYPQSFSFDVFENIKSFRGKFNYANEHLQRLSSGSARVIFKVDDEKVLKLAKNKKGIAQNEVEMEWFIQTYDVVARVFESDQENGFWLEMELARKARAADFRNLIGISFQDLSAYLSDLQYRMGQIKWSKPELNPDIDFGEIEFIEDLERFIVDYGMGVGDFRRMNSYGVVKRNGSDKLVLIDFGLTQTVYYEYYKVR